MKIHVGFDLTYESAHSTPMIFMLNVHPSRAHDLITPDRLRITPSRAISPYIDGFGNKCVRILAPPGQLRVRNWHESDVPALPAYVGYRRKTGQHMLTASFSHFYPERSSGAFIGLTTLHRTVCD